MKKKLLITLGMLVIALVFGMTVVGCDNTTGGDNNPSYSLDGTWYSPDNVYRYEFNNGNFEYYYNGSPYKKGTYTTQDNYMTMTTTHIGGGIYSSSYTWLDGSTWYSGNEFKQAYMDYYRNTLNETYQSQLESVRSQYQSNLATIRSSLQQTYDTYVSSYGVAQANSIFMSSYGTTNIDQIVYQQYGQQYEQALYQFETQLQNSFENSLNSVENSINNSLNSFYTTDTLVYQLSDMLILGNMALTKR